MEQLRNAMELCGTLWNVTEFHGSLRNTLVLYFCAAPQLSTVFCSYHYGYDSIMYLLMLTQQEATLHL
jgi:hypothetical protein